jgi:hypothetical protein
MLCTLWLRNPLTASRLFTSAANRPWRQFFSRFVKVRFRILDIQFFPPRVVKILSGTILCIHGYNNKCRFLIGYRFMNALFHYKYICFFYIKKYSKSNTYFNFNVDIFDFGFQFLSTDNRKLKIDTIYLHFTL